MGLHLSFHQPWQPHQGFLPTSEECSTGSRGCGHNSEAWGSPGHHSGRPHSSPPCPAFLDVINLYDELGSPELLLQVTGPSERASECPEVCGTCHACKAEFRAPSKCPGKWTP